MKLDKTCRACGTDDWYVYQEQTKCRECQLARARSWYERRSKDPDFLEMRRRRTELFRLSLEKSRGV